MKKYIDYIINFQCNNIEEVNNWVNINLSNYLKNNFENQNEIEHILDYLCSDKSPKRILKMSYLEAKTNSEKWLKGLIKNKSLILETESDVKVVLELDGGFKWVKLISEKSYKNEGIRMRHCVGSYFNKSVEIYSLRDSNNNPHCTIEKNKQIKGKGNGSISPKYIGFVVSFLEYLGMEVSDNQMKNLGYFNCLNFEKDLHKDSLKLKFKNYLPISSKLKDLEEKPFFDLEFITLLGLINEDGKILIDLKLLDYGIKRLINQIKNASSGNNSKNASSGNNSKNASSGDYSTNASSGDYSTNASSGDYSKNASSGDYSTNASSGYDSKNASSGNNSKNASSGNNSKNASSGDNSKNASSGNNSKNASSGNNSKNASSGDNSKNASSGDYSIWEITGLRNVVASIGYKDKVKGIIGTWVTLAEYVKNENNILCCNNVVSQKIDGVILKENVYYSLINGVFTEVD
jgi:hypothetical protein